MLLRLVFKLLWGTTKLTVRYVVIPIAISAATAAVVSEIADRIRENTPEPNGRVDAVVKPAK